MLGVGYSGAALAARLAARGVSVVLMGRREAPLRRLATELGADVRVVDAARLEDSPRAFEGLHRLVHLAPPPRDGSAEGQALALGRALGSETDRLVYGSTTGVFQVPEDPGAWVDEDTALHPTGTLGEARLAYERGLSAGAACDMHPVRIAGIYGPGRTLAERMRAGSLHLSAEGRATSRVHRDDLARMLEAMVLDEAPPPSLLACDACPATTLEVARFTAERLGLPVPPVEADEAELSSMAKEFRRSAKRCRSKYREALIGPLLYPSYREGVVASLSEPAPGSS